MGEQQIEKARRDMDQLEKKKRKLIDELDKTRTRIVQSDTTPDGPESENPEASGNADEAITNTQVGANLEDLPEVPEVIYTTRIGGLDFGKLTDALKELLEHKLRDDFTSTFGGTNQQVKIELRQGNVVVTSIIQPVSGQIIDDALVPTLVLAALKSLPGVADAMEEGLELTATKLASSNLLIDTPQVPVIDSIAESSGLPPAELAPKPPELHVDPNSGEEQPLPVSTPVASSTAAEVGTSRMQWQSAVAAKEAELVILSQQLSAQRAIPVPESTGVSAKDEKSKEMDKNGRDLRVCDSWACGGLRDRG